MKRCKEHNKCLHKQIAYINNIYHANTLLKKIKFKSVLECTCFKICISLHSEYVPYEYERL